MINTLSMRCRGIIYFLVGRPWVALSMGLARVKAEESQFSRVHNTFHVSNLKKCHANEPLAVPLDGLNLDDKLYFVEESVEIVGREVKRLKRSRIPLVKVRWNSKRGPEFTWEREDQFKKKYPHLFTKTTPSSSAASLSESVNNHPNSVIALRRLRKLGDKIVSYVVPLPFRKGLKRQKEAKTIKNQQETGKRQRVKSKSKESAKDHSRISPTQSKKETKKSKVKLKVKGPKLTSIQSLKGLL
ncbi:hypothetical protein Tco_1431176 [Tanacetum coccineum]